MARKRQRKRKQRRSLLHRRRLEILVAVICFGGALGFALHDADWGSGTPGEQLQRLTIAHVGPADTQLRVTDRSVTPPTGAPPSATGGAPPAPQIYRLRVRIELTNSGTSARVPLPSAELRDVQDTVLQTVLCVPDTLTAARLDPGESGGYSLSVAVAPDLVSRLERLVVVTR